MRARRLLAMVVLLTAACSAPPRPELAPVRAPFDPPPAPDTFTVVASGDVLVHPPLTAQARADSTTAAPDFGPMLAGVAPVVSAADLALCHLEVPLAAPGGPFAGYPSFNAAPQVATALAETGYDSCTTASNHTLDQGVDGVFRTLDALDAAGLEHTGSARSAREDATPLIHDVGPAKVAQISFTYGYNGHELPDGMPWLSNTLDPGAVLQAARTAEQAGADVVIASLHWGEPYQHEPTGEQVALAERLLAAPSLDLIVGHHAHVVQPFEEIGGEWVAYGLGNHVARHDEPRGTSEEGVIARFTFGRDPEGGWHVQRAEYVPTLVALGPPIRLLDLTTAAPRARVEEALQRTDRVVGSRGAAADGLTRPRS
ncbi:MAG: CapA family protein [Pseudonocardiaceae bacterium]|nr:CapA family protein [Pseudonocardiaceae bacterium]